MSRKRNKSKSKATPQPVAGQPWTLSIGGVKLGSILSLEMRTGNGEVQVVKPSAGQSEVVKPFQQN